MGPQVRWSLLTSGGPRTSSIARRVGVEAVRTSSLGAEQEEVESGSNWAARRGAATARGWIQGTQ